MPTATETVYYSGKGYPTPWGPAQARYKYNNDVSFYSCAGHGGYKVNKARNQAIPVAFRNDDGWYEEDCEAHIVHHYLLDDPQDSGLRQWFPDQWEQATGEKVTAEQSSIVADREFSALHVNDWVSIAAWGDWADWVPEGYVGLCATKGGVRRRYGEPYEETYWLVPKGEYHNKSFVIDPTRHTKTERNGT